MNVSVPLDLLRALMGLAMEAPIPARASFPILQQCDAIIQAAQKPPSNEEPA